MFIAERGRSRVGAVTNAFADGAVEGIRAVAAIKDRVIDEKDREIAELQRQLAELSWRTDRAVHERNIHMALSMSLLTTLAKNPTAAPIIEKARKDLIEKLKQEGTEPTAEYFNWASYGLSIHYPTKLAGFKNWVSSKEKLSLSVNQEASPAV